MSRRGIYGDYWFRSFIRQIIVCLMDLIGNFVWVYSAYNSVIPTHSLPPCSVTIGTGVYCLLYNLGDVLVRQSLYLIVVVGCPVIVGCPFGVLLKANTNLSIHNCVSTILRNSHKLFFIAP